MLIFGGLNHLEIPLLGTVSHVPEGCGAMFSSHQRGFVELPAEDGQVGRPPRFGVVEGPGAWCMLLQKCGESV